MMVALFLLLAVCVLLAWFRLRKLAIYLFIITLILSVIWFGHHMTSSIDIHL